MNGTLANPVSNNYTRYGCFPAVIGATLEHRLTQRLTFASGRFLAAGQKLHQDVADITRHPEAEGHTHWICRSPHCIGKTWASKKALIAAHPDNRELKKNEEVHCFYAFAHVPAVKGRDAVVDKQGNVTEEAVEAKPEKLLLLSDEE